MSKITRLQLEKFTAFEKLNVEFSTGVNVVMGANGTGKTHLLKTLYAACAVTTGEDKDRGFAQKLRNVFSPYEGKIGRLSQRNSKSVSTSIEVQREEGLKLTAKFSNHTTVIEKVKVTGLNAWAKKELKSAYIPVKEMLAHAPGFLSTVARREIVFEEVYTDIIKLAFLPPLLGPTRTDRKKLLKLLEDGISGKVTQKNEHFKLNR